MAEPDEAPARGRRRHDDGDDVARHVLDLLLDKVRGDHYPSNQQLDLLEKYLPRRRRHELAAILAEKVEQERYPSLQMIRRMLRLAR
jgi:hypothetical protein